MDFDWVSEMDCELVSSSMAIVSVIVMAIATVLHSAAQHLVGKLQTLLLGAAVCLGTQRPGKHKRPQSNWYCKPEKVDNWQHT